MKKISDLLSKPLVCLLEGEEVGVVQNIIFDKKLRRPKWLTVASEEHDYIVAYRDIHKSGTDAVVIKTLDKLLPPPENMTHNNPINSRVFSTSGEFLGTVKDVLLSEEDDTTTTLVCDEGEFDVMRVFSVGTHTVIIQGENENLKITSSKPARKRAPHMHAAHTQQEVLPPQTQPAAETKITPPDPQKLVGDYQFLLGRKLNRDLRGRENILLYKKNTLITAAVVEDARKLGKLIELTAKSLPEGTSTLFMSTQN